MFDCAGYVFGSGLIFRVEKKWGQEDGEYSYICHFECGIWQGGTVEEVLRVCHQKTETWPIFLDPSNWYSSHIHFTGESTMELIWRKNKQSGGSLIFIYSKA